MKVLSALLVLSVIGLSSAQFGRFTNKLTTTAKPPTVVKQTVSTTTTTVSNTASSAVTAAAAKAQAQAQAIAAAKAKAEAEAKEKAAAAATSAKATAAAAAQQAKNTISSAAAAIQNKVEAAKEDGKIKERIESVAQAIKSGANSAKEQLKEKWEHIQENPQVQEAQKKFEAIKECAKNKVKASLAGHEQIKNTLKEAENKAQEFISGMKGKIDEKLPEIKAKASEMKDNLNQKLKQWNITLPF